MTMMLLMIKIKVGGGDNEDGDGLTLDNNVCWLHEQFPCFFTLPQMERDRRRAQTPAERGMHVPQPDTTRVRTPATAGRRRQR